MDTRATIFHDIDVDLSSFGSFTALDVDVTGGYAVLGSRKGLVLIDLESPYQPVHTLAHYTRVDVGVVACNPHYTNREQIASTNNTDVLFWDAEHEPRPLLATLRKHTRAVTDLSWSPLHPCILATSSVDSCVLLWDTRAPHTPIQSFRVPHHGAQQVQWNRVNHALLASAHEKEVRVWDTRKSGGSGGGGEFGEPSAAAAVTAHTQEITGLDWSHESAALLVTCSNDRTAKLWGFGTATAAAAAAASVDAAASGSAPPGAQLPVLGGGSEAGGQAEEGAGTTAAAAAAATATGLDDGGFGTLTPMALMQRANPLQRVLFAPFGQAIITTSRGIGEQVDAPQTIRLWHISSVDDGFVHVHSFEGARGEVMGAAFRAQEDDNAFQVVSLDRLQHLRLHRIRPSHLRACGYGGADGLGLAEASMASTDPTAAPPSVKLSADALRADLLPAVTSPALGGPSGRDGSSSGSSRGGGGSLWREVVEVDQLVRAGALQGLRVQPVDIQSRTFRAVLSCRERLMLPPQDDAAAAIAGEAGGGGIDGGIGGGGSGDEDLQEHWGMPGAEDGGDVSRRSSSRPEHAEEAAEPSAASVAANLDLTVTFPQRYPFSEAPTFTLSNCSVTITRVGGGGGGAESGDPGLAVLFDQTVEPPVLEDMRRAAEDQARVALHVSAPCLEAGLRSLLRALHGLALAKARQFGCALDPAGARSPALTAPGSGTLSGMGSPLLRGANADPSRLPPPLALGSSAGSAEFALDGAEAAPRRQPLALPAPRLFGASFAPDGTLVVFSSALDFLGARMGKAASAGDALGLPVAGLAAASAGGQRPRTYGDLLTCMSHWRNWGTPRQSGIASAATAAFSRGRQASAGSASAEPYGGGGGGGSGSGSWDTGDGYHGGSGELISPSQETPTNSRAVFPAETEQSTAGEWADEAFLANAPSASAALDGAAPTQAAVGHGAPSAPDVLGGAGQSTSEAMLPWAPRARQVTLVDLSAILPGSLRLCGTYLLGDWHWRRRRARTASAGVAVANPAAVGFSGAYGWGMDESASGGASPTLLDESLSGTRHGPAAGDHSGGATALETPSLADILGSRAGAGGSPGLARQRRLAFGGAFGPGPSIVRGGSFFTPSAAPTEGQAPQQPQQRSLDRLASQRQWGSTPDFKSLRRSFISRHRSMFHEGSGAAVGNASVRMNVPMAVSTGLVGSGGSGGTSLSASPSKTPPRYAALRRGSRSGVPTASAVPQGPWPPSGYGGQASQPQQQHQYQQEHHQQSEQQQHQHHQQQGEHQQSRLSASPGLARPHSLSLSHALAPPQPQQMTLLQSASAQNLPAAAAASALLGLGGAPGGSTVGLGQRAHAYRPIPGGLQSQGASGKGSSDAALAATQHAGGALQPAWSLAWAGNDGVGTDVSSQLDTPLSGAISSRFGEGGSVHAPLPWLTEEVSLGVGLPSPAADRGGNGNAVGALDLLGGLEGTRAAIGNDAAPAGAAGDAPAGAGAAVAEQAGHVLGGDGLRAGELSVGELCRRNAEAAMCADSSSRDVAVLWSLVAETADGQDDWLLAARADALRKHSPSLPQEQSLRPWHESALGAKLVGRVLDHWGRAGDVQTLATALCVLTGGSSSADASGIAETGGACGGASLLPEGPGAPRYLRCLDSYAELLYAWGAQNTRIEVLKHRDAMAMAAGAAAAAAADAAAAAAAAAAAVPAMEDANVTHRHRPLRRSMRVSSDAAADDAEAGAGPKRGAGSTREEEDWASDAASGGSPASLNRSRSMSHSNSPAGLQTGGSPRTSRQHSRSRHRSTPGGTGGVGDDDIAPVSLGGGLAARGRGTSPRGGAAASSAAASSSAAAAGAADHRSALAGSPNAAERATVGATSAGGGPEGVLVGSNCIKCRREASGPVCNRCRDFAWRCVVCQLPVRGVVLACVACGHGGHDAHMRAWFTRNGACPTGCGCRCAEVMAEPLAEAAAAQQEQQDTEQQLQRQQEQQRRRQQQQGPTNATVDSGVLVPQWNFLAQTVPETVY